MTEESNDGLAILQQMGVDPQLVEIYDSSVERSRKVDRRICICGHATGRHKIGGTKTTITTVWPDQTIIEGGGFKAKVWRCKPNGNDCNCQTWIPTLEVSETRWFLKATEGANHRHALTKGILALSKINGHSIKWLIPPICVLCKKEGWENGLAPTPLTESGKVKIGDGSDGLDRLVCKSCREAVQ